MLIRVRLVSNKTADRCISTLLKIRLKSWVSAKKGEFSPSYENDNINNGKEPKIPSFLTEALPPPLVIGSQGTVYSDKKAENTKSLEALLKQPNLTSVSVQSTVERENDDDRQLEESDKIMEEKRQKLLNEIASDVIVETLPPLNVVGNTKHTSPNTHENLLKKGEKIENPGWNHIFVTCLLFVPFS